MQRCEIRTRPWQSFRAFIRLFGWKYSLFFPCTLLFQYWFCQQKLISKELQFKVKRDLIVRTTKKKTEKSLWKAEVAGVTFSDSDSAPVPKFLNPRPAILKVWESDSCSDSGYNHRANRNLSMLLPKKWPHRLLLLPKWKSDSGSAFLQIFDSGSGSGSERKTQNPAGVDSGNPDPVPPLMEGNLKNTKEVVLMHNSSAHLQRWVVAR